MLLPLRSENISLRRNARYIRHANTRKAASNPNHRRKEVKNLVQSYACFIKRKKEIERERDAAGQADRKNPTQTKETYISKSEHDQGSARLWFDELPPESIDSYVALRKAFLEGIVTLHRNTVVPKKSKMVAEALAELPPNEPAAEAEIKNSSYLGLRKKYRLSLKNDMPHRDNNKFGFSHSISVYMCFLLPEPILLIVYPLFQHFKTLRLDESRSPDFDLFSDQEDYSEEEVAKTMAKTMEQYMSKTRDDYGSGVVRPKIKDKDHFTLKGQFLKELRDNTFSGSKHEDVNKHIEKVLEIVDLFHIPNITCRLPYIITLQ
uniref:Reverse transcriptase domain-containing protein n=1 Tax=Tanacetum cinerariifolium TaxID=118510 RepID=A0A699I0T5_TANCI|nr:hypothetical protein [Tanacetum cinerariifolium]